MAFFKINNTDYSKFVNELKVNSASNYNAQTNAAGNTVVDYINTKRTIEVGIIPLNSVDMLSLLNDLNSFNVTLSFLNPLTNELAEGVNCIHTTNSVEYLAILANKVMYKPLTLTFTEL